jgi:2-(3-amino-3-carboxypropyl)histidine synthase
MEEDRAETDLGIAADIEEAERPPPVQKQPKKRFVGRRAAGDAARKDAGSPSLEDGGGAVQREQVNSHIVRL